VYAWLVVISLLFIAVALVTCREKKEIKLNCEACKFAEKGVCQRKPIPVATKDGICQFFIKQRAK
jgi:hypothetical protein